MPEMRDQPTDFIMKIKTTTSIGTLAFLSSISLSCFSQPIQQTQPQSWSYSTTESPQFIEIRSEKGIVKRCRIDSSANRATLSFDRKTLLISENGYIATESLNNCSNKAISTKYTPSENGYLVDFNSSKNRYIALDFVAVRPFSYIAFVGEIGKHKNLVELPGAYSDRKSLKKMQKEAFGYSEELLPQPKISSDGHYATVTGEMDCDANSHPGVWDLEKKRKVIFSKDIDSPKKCESFFTNQHPEPSEK